MNLVVAVNKIVLQKKSDHLLLYIGALVYRLVSIRLHRPSESKWLLMYLLPGVIIALHNEPIPEADLTGTLTYISSVIQTLKGDTYVQYPGSR